VRKVHPHFKGDHCRRSNVDPGDGARSDQSRSYGYDRRDYSRYRGHSRFRVQHEQTEAAMKSAEAQRAELISRIDLQVIGGGEVQK
jgi:hypothetical protein